MKRAVYRCLIQLHPLAFRRRFGAEMLWVFDEAAEQGAFSLFADAILSLSREWFLGTNAWKRVLGAVAALVLLLGWWHVQKYDQIHQQGSIRALQEATCRNIVRQELPREEVDRIEHVQRVDLDNCMWMQFHVVYSNDRAAAR